jgi:chaperonin GroEL
MKSIVSGDTALHKILAGVNLIANAVKATLGPAGKNCIYSRIGTGQPISTRDGVTVAREIEAEDVHEQMGIALIQGVANEAVDSSGDGTTTATLLAQAIFGEGVKSLAVGCNAVAIQRGIRKATEAVIQSLKEMARPVSGEMIRQVATISANNDAFLGGLIATAMEKSGEDGVVTVEVSRTPESSLQISDGLQIGTGFISPYFMNNRERGECVLEDCCIFLYEKKLATILPMIKVLDELAKEGKSILVIAEDVTDEALNILENAAQPTDPKFKKLKCCAIRTPGSVEFLHDIAALTAAKVVTDLMGTKIQDIDRSYFGHAKKVVIKAHSTTIIGDDLSPAMRSCLGGIDARLRELRTQVSEATDPANKLRLQSRLARLAGGVAIIKVGAATELEMLVRKDAIEDAMHATRGAISEGVLPGGGVALLRCSKIATPDWSDDERAGALIVSKACHAPLRTLAENCGESAEFILKQVTSATEPNYGWNARTGNFGDMVEMGVIDPLRVVRVALESASSVAATMLITHCLVANGREK